MREEQKQQDCKVGWPEGEGRAVDCFAASPGVSRWWWRLFPNLWDHLHPHTSLIHRLPGVSALLRVLHLAEGSLACTEGGMGSLRERWGRNAVTTISLPDHSI